MFTWTSPAGVEIALPFMAEVKAGVLRRNRTKEPLDAAFSILEDVADEATLKQVDDLSTDEINDLFEAWLGATPGESEPSST